MSTATITVATGKDGHPIVGIKEGKKLGYVKDNSGEFWPVDPSALPALRAGGTFNLTYEQKTFGKLVSKAVGTEPTTPAKTYPRMASPAPTNRDLQIWCSAAQNQAIAAGKVDPLDEDACVLLGETQKRIHRRLFANGQVRSDDLNDDIPIV